MKHKETKTITREEIRIVKTTCDICGAEQYKSDRWPHKSFKFDDTTFEHSYGTNYPEGGDSNTLRLDICPTCTVDKIVPFLEQLAKKSFTYEESDW
jgi:hypothetical protein